MGTGGYDQVTHIPFPPRMLTAPIPMPDQGANITPSSLHRPGQSACPLATVVGVVARVQNLDGLVGNQIAIFAHSSDMGKMNEAHSSTVHLVAGRGSDRGGLGQSNRSTLIRICGVAVAPDASGQLRGPVCWPMPSSNRRPAEVYAPAGWRLSPSVR
jgi:hypothetical protein